MEQDYETKVGNTLRCPKCQKPMGRRKEKGTFQVRKFSDGKPHNISIEMGNDYEPFRLACEDCNAGHIFVQFGGANDPGGHAVDKKDNDNIIKE